MILDQFGHAIKPADIAEPQTSRIGYLHHEFALHPSRGLTPAKLARILEDAETGNLIAQNDLFDDMEEKDAHIHAELSKRRRAVTTLERQIMPPRNATAEEKRATEYVNEIFEDLEVEDILLNMGDAIGKGFAPLEIEWKRIGKDRIPDLDLIPQRWFQLPPNDPYTDDLRLRDNTVEGEEPVPGGWIIHKHKARPGYIARSSLGRILSWPYLFKNYGVRDLAEFLEIYGLPLRLGKYPPGASKEEKATLLRAVVNIGHSAAGIIPQGMDIDFQNAAEGVSDPFMAMIDWCERSESKAILGQTLSAEAKATGMGSGVADLQSEVRDDILKSDAKQISRSMSDLCYLVAAFNGFAIAPGRGPRYQILAEDADDIQSFAKALPPLVDIGVQIPEKYVHERLKIPEPGNGERVLTPSSTVRVTDRIKGGDLPSNNAGGPAPLSLEPGGSESTLVDETDALVQPSVERWVEQVRGIVDKASSLQDLSRRLVDAFPGLDANEFAAVMTEALTLANLQGRADIEAGSE